MKVLFICRANVGRSQAAMSLYNQLYSSGASSAGTKVAETGELLADRPGAENIISVMQEYGLDISKNTRIQVTQELAQHFDKLIVMAEPETIPEWLLQSAKTDIWTIQDPKGQDIPSTRRIVKEIEQKVKHLH